MRLNVQRILVGKDRGKYAVFSATTGVQLTDGCPDVGAASRMYGEVLKTAEMLKAAFQPTPPTPAMAA